MYENKVIIIVSVFFIMFDAGASVAFAQSPGVEQVAPQMQVQTRL